MITREQILSALQSPNVNAFIRVIREKESSQEPDAFTLLNGGKHFSAPPWVHPYHGRSTFEVGHSTAAGAVQFLGTTWADVAERFPQDCGSFTPAAQIFGAAVKMYDRGALPAVLEGRLDDAIALCRKEWTSLPGAAESRSSWTLAKAAEVYATWGGQFATQPAAPIEERVVPTKPKGDASMGAAIALLPLIAEFIPQIVNLLKPNSKTAARDAALAQTVLNKAAEAAGIIEAGQTATATHVGQTVDALKDNPALIQKVQAAVLTEPSIMETLAIVEIGTGIEGARKADAAQQAAAQPFWKVSAVFWISVLLLPLVVWYVGSSIVGGVYVPEEWPWYAQLLLKLFGDEWSADARAGLANLVVGLVLGGIVGVYFGVSVTQQQGNQRRSTDTPPAA